MASQSTVSPHVPKASPSGKAVGRGPETAKPWREGKRRGRMGYASAPCHILGFVVFLHLGCRYFSKGNRPVTQLLLRRRLRPQLCWVPAGGWKERISRWGLELLGGGLANAGSERALWGWALRKAPPGSSSGGAPTQCLVGMSEGWAVGEESSPSGLCMAKTWVFFSFYFYSLLFFLHDFSGL